MRCTHSLLSGCQSGKPVWDHTFVDPCRKSRVEEMKCENIEGKKCLKVNSKKVFGFFLYFSISVEVKDVININWFRQLEFSSHCRVFHCLGLCGEVDPEPPEGAVTALASPSLWDFLQWQWTSRVFIQFDGVSIRSCDHQDLCVCMCLSKKRETQVLKAQSQRMMQVCLHKEFESQMKLSCGFWYHLYFYLISQGQKNLFSG